MSSVYETAVTVSVCALVTVPLIEHATGIITVISSTTVVLSAFTLTDAKIPPDANVAKTNKPITTLSIFKLNIFFMFIQNTANYPTYIIHKYNKNSKPQFSVLFHRH